MCIYRIACRSFGVTLAALFLVSKPAVSQPNLTTLAPCERLLAQGDTKTGVPCLKRALSQIASGEDDRETLTAYRIWAEAFARARQIDLARDLYEEGLATRAGKRPSVALGLLHFSYSRLLSRPAEADTALGHARSALGILERTAGPEAYDTIAARDHLATQLINTGAVAPGLNLAEENFETSSRALGDEEPLTWRTANNFAEALRSIGRPEAAIPIDSLLLKKRVAHYGEGSIQALVSASNLALSYLELGKKDEALRYFALQGRFGAKLGDPRSEHEAQGKAWIAYTNILFDPDPQLKPDELTALMRMKDWPGAPELLQVKATQLAAAVYEKQGKVRQGLSLRETAYRISVVAFTERNPITFDALLGVAQAHVRNRNAETALETFRHLDALLYAWTLEEIGTAGNRFIAETMRVLADNFLHAFGSFALETVEARAAFADAAARWKTMESGERTRLRSLLVRAPDDLKPLIRDVIRLFGQQQELLSERRTVADRAQDAALVEELKRKRAMLSERLRAAGSPGPVDGASEAPVEAALADTDGLINFVAITQRAGTRSSADAVRDQRLLAVVRRKDRSPAVIDLGPLKAVLAGTSAKGSSAEGGSGTGSSGAGTAGADVPLGEAMFSVLFAPLAEPLRGVDRLFVVPDATLYAIPFPLLRPDKGRYMDQLYELRILTREDAVGGAGREAGLAAGGKAVLAGGLDFSKGPETGAKPLPMTKTEVDEVGRMLETAGYRTTRMTDASGTEAALRSAVPQAEIIHLATHGFFEPPRDGTSALWRGGLVLARSGSPKPPRPDATDGYLYAQELMAWDLSAADLVVLSACETAIGDRSAVSAIRGLPTALGIAGARRSLLTLWPVDDAGAANFMIAFYKHAAAPGTTFAQALRLTRLDAIAGKIPGADSPELWASFVMFES